MSTLNICEANAGPDLWVRSLKEGLVRTIAYFDGLLATEPVRKALGVP